MRIYFHCATREKPSGGEKQHRLMASLFVELGADTFLLRDRRFFSDRSPLDDYLFPDTQVPSAPFAFEDAGSHLQSEDVVILQEGVERLPSCWRSWKCRIGLNNQNGFFSLCFCPGPDVCRNTFEFAISNAPYVASICKDFLAIPAKRIFPVSHWVIRPPFELTDVAGTRAPSICYMPRKLPEEVRRVRQLVLQTHPNVPWVEIDGVPEVEVARRMRANSIFFAAHDVEGCPTSGLEAMACGCLVAGYGGTGHFPHPYATPMNGIWVPDRSVSGAANAVRSAIQVVHAGGETYSNYLKNGRQTAERFSKQMVLQALRDLLEAIRNRSYESRRHTIKGMGWRGTLYAYRLLYNFDRLGWPGRFLSRVSKLTKPLRSSFAKVRT